MPLWNFWEDSSQQVLLSRDNIGRETGRIKMLVATAAGGGGGNAINYLFMI